MRALLPLSLAAGVGATSAPTGLLVDYKTSPSLGVRQAPHFGWIVPPCDAGGADHLQTAYQLVVSTSGMGGLVWDSGKVTSDDSTYVAYGGPALSPGAPYVWKVTTWTAATAAATAPCQSAASAPAAFITNLDAAADPATGPFANTTFFLSPAAAAAANGPATFGYFRKELASTPPAGAVTAQAFITAKGENPLLNFYKLSVDGALVDVGPGRGEAPIWGGDGAYRSVMYTTLDLTAQLLGGSAKHAKRGTVLSIVSMCSKGTQVGMQLTWRDAGGAVVSTAGSTDASWSAFDGDAHRKPGPGQHGHSAGTGFLEYIDANHEPVGWQLPGFAPTAAWAAPVATAQLWPGLSPKDIHAKMEPPMQVTLIDAASVVPAAPAPSPPPAPPTGIVSCARVAENAKVQLGCPGAAAISGVKFASFSTPDGSCAAGFTHDATCDDANRTKTMEIVESACVGKTGCTIKASRNVFGDACLDVVKTLAVEIECPTAPPTPTPPPPPPTPAPVPSSFLVDFGKEFQGGLRLSVTDGTAGTNVHISCGESLSGTTAGSTWGWEFDWTLRDGAQLLEQHKYMECRFVNIEFSAPGGAAAPAHWALGAWKVHYPWVESDSSFTSSNATLNAVWELCRYTLHAASLDTYTDSNTRERRPYEADGIIAATGRLLVQRDVLWARHSHAWVIHDPTWPVEWKQLSAFLGYQDYTATGQPDLALALMDEMHDRTMVKFLDAKNGLLDTSKMGRHIVDWMPDAHESDETVARGEFTASSYNSVSNMFGARGLEMLSEMVGAGGRAENATAFAAQGAALRAAIDTQMWNGSAYCDGVCADVKGNSLLMTNMFGLSFGFPQTKGAAAVASAWSTTADWGMTSIGDYGAFWYQHALAGGYYANADYDGADNGSALYHALTKCDHDSWCSGLAEDNLTMTRESWHDGTYSHQWGASAIVGVVWGLMGVHVTSPGWGTFTVKPKLGGLGSGDLKIPTMRGFISVQAKAGEVAVAVPCNSMATLCVPRAAADGGALFTPLNARLLLDGAEVGATTSGGHLCAAQPVGCGAAGAPRRLTAQQR